MRDNIKISKVEYLRRQPFMDLIIHDAIYIYIMSLNRVANQELIISPFLVFSDGGINVLGLEKKKITSWD